MFSRNCSSRHLHLANLLPDILARMAMRPLTRAWPLPDPRSPMFYEQEDPRTPIHSIPNEPPPYSAADIRSRQEVRHVAFLPQWWQTLSDILSREGIYLQPPTLASDSLTLERVIAALREWLARFDSIRDYYSTSTRAPRFQWRHRIRYRSPRQASHYRRLA